VFGTQDELLQWVRKIVFGLSFVVVILRSDKATGAQGRKTYVLLGCERSGKYRKYSTNLAGSITGTRKCDCPYRLRGKPIKSGEGWVLKVVCGLHNHELAKTLVGHPYAGRLRPDKHVLVVDMIKIRVKRKNILLTLKEKNEDNVTTIKQLYNTGYTNKRSVRGSRIKLQRLMMLLECDNYIHWHRSHESSQVVSDIFWTHPDSLKLLNAFSNVLLMDNTYKTNKYRLPLLKIVGVTLIGLTFSAAFVLMSSECENNFTWALQRLQGLFFRDVYPTIIVCDRNLALMNAIKVIFP